MTEEEKLKKRENIDKIWLEAKIWMEKNYDHLPELIEDLSISGVDDDIAIKYLEDLIKNNPNWAVIITNMAALTALELDYWMKCRKPPEPQPDKPMVPDPSQN